MILVVGSTGQLGGRIASALLAQGERVRIMVRPGSPSGALVAAGAEPVVGDLKAAATLVAACAGVDAVITTANSASRTEPDTVESVDLLGNLALVDAAESCGVRRFVFVSALGADVSHPMPLLRAKGAVEERLRSSHLAWTALRPNVYMDRLIPLVVGAPALAGRPVTLVGSGHRRHSFVATGDVAAYCLAALRAPDAAGRAVTVAGPESISWTDVVEAFEREVGRAISVNHVAPGEPVPDLPDFVTGLLAALETYDSPIDMSATARWLGVVPTPLATYVHEFVEAAGRRDEAASRA